MSKTATKLIYSISDTRWCEAVIEPYNFINDTEAIQSAETYFHKQDCGITCTVCKVSVGEDRTDFLLHYKSNWHRHNLRRILQGRPLLTEDEFEQKISDNDSVSPLDTEDDDDVVAFSGGAYSYFVSDGTVYSIYRCILRKNELISRNLFRHPLDCALFLLSGGHFCGGIFKDDKLITQKSFHRYIIRAKQGTAQSVSDARGSAAKSAGASVRRYNEKALKSEIQGLLVNWSKLLDESPLIFLRCPTSLRRIFFEQTNDFELDKTDERLRSIPFETYRPTLDELQRTWSKLKVVRSHGSLEDFNDEQRNLTKLRKKQRQLFRQKISERGKHWSSESSSESDIPDRGSVEIKQQQREVEKANLKQPEVLVNLLSKEHAQAVYTSIRLNSITKLQGLLNSNKESKEVFLKYIQETKFPPGGSTFLHIAARRGTIEILEELLLLGCDPAVKDNDGKVPYQVSQNRAVRQAFSKFRSEHPDSFNWNISQVPELMVLTEEKLVSEAEKKRIQREKKKQRNKAKRAAYHLEKIEQEQREKYLALSDREKRAIAAERRLALSLQKHCQVVQNDGNRCFKCGAVLVSKPFEYCDNRFCSLACLQQHRKEHPPQLIS